MAESDGDNGRETAGERTERQAHSASRPTADRLLHTGAEGPIDPEDLIRAKGREPTPELVEKVRRALAEEGPSAIERVLP